MTRISKTNAFKAALSGILLSVIFLTTGSWQKVKDDTGLELGQKMPLATYKMEGIDDQEHSLDDLMGDNGLIVVFSCNTCPFVVGSDNFAGWEGQYNDLYSKAKAQNIEMVLVNSNEAKREGDDSKAEMKAHADAQGYTMPYVIDKNAKLADAMGAKTTPHVYLFDKNKKLVYKGSIDNTWDTKATATENYLADAIAALGAGTEIKNKDTPPRGCSIKRTK